MRRSEQVKSLFHDALQLPAGAGRDRWIEDQCRGDGDLLEDVLSLLDSDREIMGAGQAMPRPEPTIPSASFGAYQAVELVGRGGMSTVYRAQRADGQFDRTVALKIMAGYMAGPEFLRRFETERRLLASLDHVNITRLLDGGISSMGDPFLITEYVEGDAIDDYCGQRKLGVEARLEIFLQVCDAVNYAHRNLIVHRDLKPANILVNREGTVKLLDFGTAALQAPDGDIPVTRSRMLTPRYASPEQLRGKRLNTSTDIFSLGVVLYELLTGAWPFGDPHSVLSELNRATSEVAAKPPAAAVTTEASASRGTLPAELSRILKGDVSVILLKALDNDPARRYESVAQFAADIENYLGGRPVRARRQTAVYRAGKFLRRHWLPAAATAAFALGLSTAAIVAIRQAGAARAEARKAEKVNHFLNDMLSSAYAYSFDPRRFTVAQMLEAAELRLAKGWQDDRLAEATLRRSLGASYLAIRGLDRAQFHLQRALAIYERLGEEQESVATLAQLAAIAVEDRPEKALQLLETALDRLRRLGGAAPAPVVFEVKCRMGTVLAAYMKRRLPEARVLLAEAVALAEHDFTIRRSSAAWALAQLGSIDLDQGEFGAAEAAYSRAFIIGRQDDPGGSWETLPLNGMMRLNARRRNLAAAKEFARQSYEVSAKALGSDHPASATSKLAWARYRADTGEIPQALAEVDEAIPVVRKGYVPPAINLLVSLSHAAHVMNRAGRLTAAESYARESLTMVDAAQLQENDWRRADTLLELGAALCAQKKYGEGVADLQEAEAIYRQIGPGFTGMAEQVREMRTGAQPPVDDSRAKVFQGKSRPGGRLRTGGPPHHVPTRGLDSTSVSRTQQ